MSDTLKNEFETQWQNRRDALQHALEDVPSDEAMLDMARRAQEAFDPDSASQTIIRRRYRWVPYAAAASLLAAVSVIGLTQNQKGPQMPTVKQVIVDGRTVSFLCNSDCSASDVLHSVDNILVK